MNLNKNSYELLAKLAGFKGVLKKEFQLDSKKAVLLDVGVDTNLSAEKALKAGILTARASAGCLADIKAEGSSVEVSIKSDVAIATLGCQMAGWAIPIQGENALASGPARILARKPKSIFEKVRYEEKSRKAALVLESNKIPDESSLKYILDKTNASELAIAVFKGDSQVGLLNVLARVVELAVYRLDFLGYDVNNIISARGNARMPEDIDMCSANDALIYNSSVELEVKSWDEKLTDKCVSKSSKAFGKKFKEIYDKAGCDFYKIDPAIFAPARIKIKEVNSAKTYEAGI
ncbi:MAG: hypothetical protein FJY77_01750 [Candidatus Altiarchaeales archaeon]|nr:hypothetical protein [Candidatus Altiarchaeales archaeon]